MSQMMPVDDRGSTGVVARLSMMMFLQFFVWGAWYVSQTGYMGAKGMSPLIAWAYTVGPIAAIISPFFLGMIADRFFASQKVLGVLHLIGGGVMLLVPSMAGAYTDGAKFLHPYVLLLMVHMLCYMPTLGLTTSLSMHNLTNSEKQFPIVRVWGTIGWIVGSVVVGGSLTNFGIDVTWFAEGDRSPVQYFVSGIAGVVLGLYAFSLPDTPPPLAGKRVTAREILGLDALSLFAKPSYFVFIMCSFLLCIPLAGYYNWARTFVDETWSAHAPLVNGVKEYTNATGTMTLGQGAEIFFMLIMPLCFARLGVKWMLAVGMAAWVVRYALFAGAAEEQVKWMVLGGIVLHGICYDFFFVTGMVYVDKTAPASIRGQAQGLLVLVTQGLGLGLGAQAFGWLVARHTVSAPPAPDVLDWKQIWTWPAVFAAVILVIFVAAFRNGKKTEVAAPEG
ncbi:Putative nucleoside transporter YegT [Phycisphaerales bacterium]|nr:Putative nucleoside transporter YegT [Phycisphaerales bacterium]